MVAMSAAQLEADSGAASRSRRRQWLALFAIPVCMLFGYMLVRGWQRYQEHQAIGEVHLLADWDALKTVGSYEWLEKLTTVNDLASVSKRTSMSELGVGLVPKSNAERRAWIAKLSPTDRDRLSANLEDFNNFKQNRPAAELNKIIELGNRIYNSPNAEELLHVARSYAIFLSDMGVTDRAAHLDITDLEKRREELQRRVNRKLVEVYANDLPTDSPDKRTIAEWKVSMEVAVKSTSEEMFRESLQASMQFSNELDELMLQLSPETRDILGGWKTRACNTWP